MPSIRRTLHVGAITCFFLSAGASVNACAGRRSTTVGPSGAATAAAKTEPGLVSPGDRTLNVARLRSARSTYTWTAVRDGQARPAGTLTDDVTRLTLNGRAVLQRIQTASRGGQDVVDTTLSDAKTLAPITHRSQQPRRSIRLEFSGQRVTGVVAPVQGADAAAATRAIDRSYPQSMFDSGNWDLVLRALALNPGLAVRYLAYDVDHDGPVEYSGRVDGLEMVNGQAAWRVSAHLGSDRITTAWIDQATRELVRLESTLAPGMLLRQERAAPNGKAP